VTGKSRGTFKRKEDIKSSLTNEEKRRGMLWEVGRKRAKSLMANGKRHKKKRKKKSRIHAYLTKKKGSCKKHFFSLNGRRKSTLVSWVGGNERILDQEKEPQFISQ